MTEEKSIRSGPILVVGASGTGKSTLIRDLIVPSLMRSHISPRVVFGWELPDLRRVRRDSKGLVVHQNLWGLMNVDPQCSSETDEPQFARLRSFLRRVRPRKIFVTFAVDSEVLRRLSLRSSTEPSELGVWSPSLRKQIASGENRFRSQLRDEMSNYVETWGVREATVRFLNACEERVWRQTLVMISGSNSRALITPEEFVNGAPSEAFEARLRAMMDEENR